MALLEQVGDWNLPSDLPLHNTLLYSILIALFFFYAFDIMIDYFLFLVLSNPVCSLHYSGQGGYAYLKEWLWWAGLISSMTLSFYVFICH